MACKFACVEIIFKKKIEKSCKTTSQFTPPPPRKIVYLAVLRKKRKKITAFLFSIEVQWTELENRRRFLQSENDENMKKKIQGVTTSIPIKISIPSVTNNYFKEFCFHTSVVFALEPDEVCFEKSLQKTSSPLHGCAPSECFKLPMVCVNQKVTMGTLKHCVSSFFI